jgi:hypothetical protein
LTFLLTEISLIESKAKANKIRLFIKRSINRQLVSSGDVITQCVKGVLKEWYELAYFMIQSTALFIAAAVETIFTITVGYVYIFASRKAHRDYA